MLVYVQTYTAVTAVDDDRHCGRSILGEVKMRIESSIDGTDYVAGNKPSLIFN